MRTRILILVLLVGSATPTACQEPDTAAQEAASLAGGTLAHAEVVFTPRYDQPDGLLDRPDSLVLVLTLQLDGAGILAIENRYWPGAGPMTAVEWARRGNAIELAPGDLSERNRDWSWETWSLALEDTDGDGILDTGTGSMRGRLHQSQGDVMDFAGIEAGLRARPDRSPPLAAIRAAGPPGQRHPVSDRIEIAFSEPVSLESVRGRVRVLAGGEPVVGELEPWREVGGLVTGAILRHEDFLPFGTPFALDPGGAVDGAGNEVTWNGDTLRTPADPGSFAGHLPLQAGLPGWIVEGGVVDTVRFQNRGPTAGDRFAVVPAGGRLTGYLDVPTDASALELSVTVYSEIGEFDPGVNAVISLLLPGQEIAVYDAAGVADPRGPCEECDKYAEGVGGVYGHRTGPTPVTIDLTPYRGKRLFLSAAAGSSGYYGMNENAIVLDALRLR